MFVLSARTDSILTIKNKVNWNDEVKSLNI